MASDGESTEEYISGSGFLFRTATREWFWLIGVLCTFVGATMTVLGFVLQKISHQKQPGGLKSGSLSYMMSWRWLVGLLIWLAGQGVCWLADGLASRSILACCNCWNIVVVFVLSPWLCGEVVERGAVTGALVAIAGCIWVVCAGPKEYREQTVATINESWTSAPVLIVVAVTVVYILAIGAWSRCKLWMKASRGGELSQEFAATSAAFAWYAILFAKCTSTLFMTSVEGNNQVNTWEFWLFGFGLLCCGFAQLHTLNMALQISQAVSVLPTYEALSMSGQIIICGIFFREFSNLEAWEFALFILGVLCVLLGVVILVRSSRAPPAEGKAEEGALGARDAGPAAI